MDVKFRFANLPLEILNQSSNCSNRQRLTKIWETNQKSDGKDIYNKMHVIKSKSSVLIDNSLQRMLQMHKKPKNKRYVETSLIDQNQIAAPDFNLFSIRSELQEDSEQKDRQSKKTQFLSIISRGKSEKQNISKFSLKQPAGDFEIINAEAFAPEGSIQQ